MQQELSKFSIAAVLVLAATFFATTARAVCPVCVVAVGAGLGLSRWLGVDDFISSLWIGAILIALVLWTLNWMQKKNWRFPIDAVVIFLVYYSLTFVPLYYAGIVGHPLNVVFGIDKIVLGTGLGTVIFLFANWLQIHLKERNGRKVLFYYQKVVVPVTILLITSLVLFLLINYKVI